MRETANVGVAHLDRGLARPSLSLKEMVDVLVEHLGDDLVRQPKDLDGAPHVELTTSVPYVDGKGWINLIGGWHYWSQPDGGAHWSGPPLAGKAEIWLRSLTPGTTYVVAIDTGCIVMGDDASFEVRSSLSGPIWIGAQPPAQTLVLMVEADNEMALVTVEPQQLATWSLYKASVFELG